jgi:hypothetical protein
MNPMNALRDMRTIKVLLTEAERIARDLGDDEPGAEHLLLSAIGLPDGAAARALGRFDVDAARLRSAIEREHADALAAIGIDAVTVEPIGAGGVPGRRCDGAIGEAATLERPRRPGRGRRRARHAGARPGCPWRGASGTARCGSGRARLRGQRPWTRAILGSWRTAFNDFAGSMNRACS